MQYIYNHTLAKTLILKLILTLQKKNDDFI